MTERELRAYLLGQATEGEAARLEARLLEDDELFQVLESIEDDLFDDHACGRLDGADRKRFEARYGIDGDRQRFARALSKRTNVGSTLPPVRPAPLWLRWAALAAAAVVAIAVGAILERQVTPMPPVPVPLPAPSFAPRELAFALTLGTSRAAEEQTLLTIPRDVGAIQLRVRLNPADRFTTYTVDLRSSKTDAQVWRGEGLAARIDNGDLVVAARVPAAVVPDGAYELAVRGVRVATGGAANTSEDLGFAPLKVVRVP